MESKLRAVFFLWVLGAMISCVQEEKEKAEAIIDHVENSYAPDRRVAFFDIEWEKGQLLGETNIPEALVSLRDSLKEQKIDFQNKVTVLPHESLGDRNFAVVTLSVANLRSQPKHSAELATQATLGTPLAVLKKKDDWYLVQTPDRYISWVDAGGIALMNKEEKDAWSTSEKIVFTDQVGYLYEQPADQIPVSDLAAGNILELVLEGDEYHKVKLPDGREGFISATSSTLFEQWIASRNTSAKNLISTAKDMMGIPYLWGGTSIKGVDCSGFTKTIFFLNGRIIPRDASQQVLEGEEVDRDKKWQNLEPGDLLFFGKAATDETPERVVHVGMWIGEGSFIHSQGRVRISSFDPASENYDEYELNRYLRTKRIIGKNSQNILAVNEIIK
jgi:cell wall-associated NlpC family hydrolase